MSLMASGDPESENESKNVSILGSGVDETVLRAYRDKLVEGATILKPFDTFGMLTNTFGIRWMISFTPKGESISYFGGLIP